jgi:hypothetical protein
LKNFLFVVAAAVIVSVPAMMVDAAIQKQERSRISAASKMGFQKKIENRLNYLAGEIEDLRKRRNDIIKRRNEQYRQEIAVLDERKAEVESLLESIRSAGASGFREAKVKLDVSLAALENEVERVENEYAERNFGLADILGF